MLKENSKAPNFTFLTDDNKDISLENFKGKKVIIYFYPKDNTPGCTKEACSFRDAYDDFVARGAVVIGISPDSSVSHKKFREKFNLQFFLMSDPDHKVAEMYGAWGEKSMYGKKYMGIMRTTFVIDEKGDILKVFEKVKPENHAAEILSLL